MPKSLYVDPGPTHLSMGQEAGEILAKGLRSMQILSDEELNKIMNEFWDGTTLAVAGKDSLHNLVREPVMNFGAINVFVSNAGGKFGGIGLSQVPMRKGCSPEDVTKTILYAVEQTGETGQRHLQPT